MRQNGGFVLLVIFVGFVSCGDINRQAIVFYPETPDLFYCPQEKPISLVSNICCTFVSP
jgi:hypothetical protein